MCDYAPVPLPSSQAALNHLDPDARWRGLHPHWPGLCKQVGGWIFINQTVQSRQTHLLMSVYPDRAGRTEWHVKPTKKPLMVWIILDNIEICTVAWMVMITKVSWITAVINASNLEQGRKKTALFRVLFFMLLGNPISQMAPHDTTLGLVMIWLGLLCGILWHSVFLLTLKLLSRPSYVCLSCVWAAWTISAAAICWFTSQGATVHRVTVDTGGHFYPSLLPQPDNEKPNPSSTHALTEREGATAIKMPLTCTSS